MESASKEAWRGTVGSTGNGRMGGGGSQEIVCHRDGSESGEWIRRKIGISGDLHLFPHQE